MESCLSQLLSGQIHEFVFKAEWRTLDEMAYQDGNSEPRSKIRWAGIFADVQFWVPFAVLIVGLLLLRLVE
jgi:hypothetical protein